MFHRSILVGLVQFMNLGELVMYLVIWRSASRQDKSLLKSGMLSTEKIAGRSQKNVITFTGQLVGFVCRLVFMLAFIITIKLKGNTIERSVFPLLVSVESTLISAVMLITSPEMRRHYFS